MFTFSWDNLETNLVLSIFGFLEYDLPMKLKNMNFIKSDCIFSLYRIKGKPCILAVV